MIFQHDVVQFKCLFEGAKKFFSCRYLTDNLVFSFQTWIFDTIFLLIRLLTPQLTVPKDRTTTCVSRKEWKDTPPLTTTTMANMWTSIMENVGWELECFDWFPPVSVLNCGNIRQSTCVPAGGGLHWLHAHSEGAWPGEGDQEEGGALRPRTLCHCTVTLDLPAPLQRALRALAWETQWQKAIFLFPCYQFCYDTNRICRVPLTTRRFQVCLFFCFLLFLWISWQAELTRPNTLPLLRPGTVTALAKKLHHISYLCNTTLVELP